ncbi:hypothetical protein PO909_029878, partial [Leuciscus waleckii]
VTDDDSEPWVPLSGQQSLSGGAEVCTLNENSSHYDFDNGSEDAHDVGHITVTNDDSEPWVPLSGQQSLSGGAEGCGLHADCGDSIPRSPTSPLLFEDECSTESEPHFNDEPNCSQASPNTSNCIADDSLGSIIGSEEEYSILFDESPDESVNEESLLGEVSHEQVPLENEEPLYTENTQLTSKHLFLKELKPVEGHLQCHIYCPNSEYYIGDQDSEGQCVVCHTTWDKNSSLKNGNFFIYLPIQTQLEHLLQREDIAQRLKSRDSTCNSETYEDIGSGKMYHNLYKIGGPLHCTHGYSLTLNCDGVPVFKSSLYGIWPLYGIVNELPYPVRKENVLLFGLWFGDKKPNVNTFLKPFTLECQKLSTAGFKIKRNSLLEQCRVVAALMMCDSVARPILQNMTQCNGRDHASTIIDAREALHTKTSVRGVKGTTCLIKIPHFDIISGMPPDHMHNVHLGVVRQMASMWLDSDNHEKPYYIGNRVNELDEQLLLIKPPCNITRVPRSLQQRRFWKASEWQNWLLFYSIFVLKGILPRVFYQHWLVLVTFMYLLCKVIITTEDIQKCEKLVVDFVKQFETLYGKTHVSFNVHLCLHLPESVRNWGPLWAHSGYIFESFNGDILKMFHGTQCVPLQIMKQFTYRQILPLLRNDALKNAVPECIQLFSNLTGRKRLKQFERVCDQLVTLADF